MTSPHQFNFISSDLKKIACARWDARSRVRGVVQIAHGLGEHIGRYTSLIETFVAAGLTVYGNDHRGHGQTAASAKQLGDFGPGGFDLLVADMVWLNRIARKENPDRPLLLLGHSLGSFAAQKFVLDHSRDIDGLILSGTGVLDGLARLTGSAPRGSNILNAPFEPARTPFDWLSRDAAVVDRFMHDPLCFAQLKPAALASFLASARQLASPEHLQSIRRDLPVYVLSGTDDSAGQQLKGVGQLLARYRQAGIAHLTSDFYRGGRHEMLNEINRDEVIANLLRWINETLEKRAAHPNGKLPVCPGMVPKLPGIFSH